MAPAVLLRQWPSWLIAKRRRHSGQLRCSAEPNHSPMQLSQKAWPQSRMDSAVRGGMEAKASAQIWQLLCSAAGSAALGRFLPAGCFTAAAGAATAAARPALAAGASVRRILSLRGSIVRVSPSSKCTTYAFGPLTRSTRPGYSCGC